jgi:hypothetical protein
MRGASPRNGGADCDLGRGFHGRSEAEGRPFHCGSFGRVAEVGSRRAVVLRRVPRLCGTADEVDGGGGGDAVEGGVGDGCGPSDGHGAVIVELLAEAWPPGGRRWHIFGQQARLEGFEPPLTQIRSLRLCPLSYRRGWRFDWRAAACEWCYPIWAAGGMAACRVDTGNREGRRAPGLERESGRQTPNPVYEQARERDEVRLLILTFAESPEPGTSPAPNTSPPGLDSGQVVEDPPPDNAPAGRLGHWQG